MRARDPALNYVAILSTVFPAATILGHFYSNLDKENPSKKMVAAFGKLQFISLFLQHIMDPHWPGGAIGGLGQAISPKYVLFELSEWRVPKRANRTSQNGLAGSLTVEPAYWEPRIPR
jgi:hypothetical protein